MSDEKKIKVVTGEGQETFVPESISRDDTLLKRLLASFYGTDNFRIERKEENGEALVRVVKMAGAKGNLPALRNCPSGENPVQALYRELADLDLAQLAPEDIPILNRRVEEALAAGTEQYQRLQSARTRLVRARSFPAPLPITGF